MSQRCARPLSHGVPCPGRARRLLALSVVAFAAISSISTLAAAERRAVIWLHGHPGSTRSPKIRSLRRLLSPRGIAVLAPELNTPESYGVHSGVLHGYSVSNTIAIAERLVEQHRFDSVVLVGHSLGGFAAAQVAAKSPKLASKLAGLVLLAPAFAPELNEVKGLVAKLDLLTGRYEPYPKLDPSLPVQLFQGTRDRAIDPERSRLFAQRQRRLGAHVDLRVLDDDHALRDHSEQVVKAAASFIEQIWPGGDRKVAIGL